MSKPSFDILGFLNSLLETVNQFPWLAQKAIGLVFIILGLLGLILPLIPGWLFILPGITIVHPPFGKWMKQFEQKKKILKRFQLAPKIVLSGRFKRLLPIISFQ
ncbi:MAG: hypothetical protein ACRCXZ_01950 [Patescibacteria group bacterium]